MIFGLEKQSRRRVAVVLIYALAVAQLAFLRGFYGNWFPREMALGGAAVLAGTFVGAVWLMNKITQPYGLERAETGDERQRRVRDAAYRRAYLIFTTGVLLFNIYTDLSMSKKLSGRIWSPLTDQEWRVVSWALVFAAITIPQAIIAWQEPDPPAEEDPSAMKYAAPSL